MGADLLTDSRQGSNKQHLLVPLLRQSTTSRLAGYEDVNDAERLAVDPAMRHVVGGRASQPERQAASASEVGRFETETLSTKANLTALMNLSGEWIDKVHRLQGMGLCPRLAGHRTGRKISKILRQIVRAARIDYICSDGVHPMTVPSRPLKELFLSALEVAPNDRAEWLDRECAGDEGLREQLNLMLAAHDAPHSLLDQPAVVEPGATVAQPITEKPGTVIGPYKLLQEIGHGGMGVVYMADQTEPVKRRVALKIIKPGMDTRQVIARFEAERQALAMMDHPNIAKVLDAGTTDSDRPYFVMELVKGVPITQFCDEKQLTPRERLELFVPVCQAIQHAHQKGIIHRDIKPSNVLVAEYDDRPIPKVIDFGVAKATEQQLTEKTVFTQLGQVVGTVDYMSPEQAKFNQLDIDTRSDIYSLGVLLYELLTGETPFDRERLHAAAFDELLRIIREEEPLRPSLRLGSSESLPSIAAFRHTEPKKLTKLVRGELDWIVMKALEKDRTRRYETATGFANDVQRYLDDEPVVACPPSLGYRFRKTLRRHRTAVTVSAVVLGFLLLFVGSVGWMMRDRKAREQEVARERATQRGIVEESATSAMALSTEYLEEGEWDRALAEARRAETVVEHMVVDEQLRKRIVTRIEDLLFLQRVDELRTASPENGKAIRAAFAEVFQERGIDVFSVELDEAVNLCQKSEIPLELASALDAWAWASRSESEREKLLQIARATDQDLWRNQVRKAFVARDLTRLQELANGKDVVENPAATLTLLAHALKGLGDPNAAADLLLKCQPRHRDDFKVNLFLGTTLRETSPPRLHEAMRFLQAALALHPNDAGMICNLGNGFADQGRLDEAVATYREAIAVGGSDWGWGGAYSNLGSVLIKQDKLDEAINAFRKAIEQDPDYAKGYSNLGLAFVELGKMDDAIIQFHKAIQLNPDFFQAYCNLGGTYNKQGKPDEAIDCLRKALELRPNRAKVHNYLGSVLATQGKVDQAIECFEKAIELDPNNANAHYSLGNALLARGTVDQAIAEFRKAIELNPDYVEAHINLGATLVGRGKPDEAIAEYQKALELAPDHPFAHNNLGNVLKDRGMVDEAIAEYRQAIKLAPDYAIAHRNLGGALARGGMVDQAIAEFRNAIKLDPDYADARVDLGVALFQQGNADEAIAEYQKALAELSKEQASTYRPQIVDNLAKMASIWCWRLATAADASERDPAKAVELGTLATEHQPDVANHWNTLGVAQYRAGNWQAAVEALEKGDAMIEGRDCLHRMFLAMAYWQLGDKKKARECYAEGAAWIASHATNDEEQIRFRAEVENLMEISEEDRERVIKGYLAREVDETADTENANTNKAGTAPKARRP